MAVCILLFVTSIEAVPTLDSDAWRKLKHALKVETIPDFVSRKANAGKNCWESVMF